jgi:hypothetical protein
VAEDLQQRHGPIAVWYTGGRDHHSQEQSSGVGKDMPFAAIDVLIGIVAVDPPFSVVVTD